MESVNEIQSFTDNEGSPRIVPSLPLLRTLEKGIAETIEENIAFKNEMATTLNKLDLGVQTLENGVQEELHKVALTLLSEKLMDTDSTTVSVIREEIKIGERRKRRAERKLLRKYDELFQKQKLLSEQLDELSKSVASLTDVIEVAQKDQNDLYSDRMLMSTKLSEYQQTAEKLEADLKSMGVDDLYPEKILTKHKQYLELSSELVELDRGLSRYESLPPNLVQAKLLLDTKRKEYETLEQEFLHKLAT